MSTDLEADVDDSPDDCPSTAGGLVHPLTGEILDPADIDALLDAYEAVGPLDKSIWAFKGAAGIAIGNAVAAGTGKTRHWHGRRKATITLPAETWDQRQLRELWHEFPELARGVIEVAAFKVGEVKFRKLMNTAGGPELEKFKRLLAGAKRQPTGRPQIKVVG